MTPPTTRRAAAPPRRPRRGDGVRALNPDGTVPPPPPAEPHGRRLLDFGGPLWRWLIALLAVACGSALVGPAIGAAYLSAKGLPFLPYLESMQSWTVNVVFGLLGLLVVQVARRQGIAQRSQKTITANQFATAASVEALAAEVAALRADLVEHARRPAPAEAPRDVEGEVASRLLRGIDLFERLLDAASRTGPLRVVAVRTSRPEPPPPMAPVTGPVAVEPEPELEDQDEDGEDDDEEGEAAAWTGQREPSLDDLLAGGYTWRQIVEGMDARDRLDDRTD